MFKKTNGLTLIELVVSLALIGLVLQVVYSLFLMGNTTFDYSSNKTFAQQEVRLLSDVVNSELKYVTNMTTDPTVVEEHFLGNYYSMELEIVNDIPVLIRKYYEDDGEDYIVTEKRTAGASAPYKSFRLVNNEEGIVQLTIDHELKKGKLATGYSLPLDIHLLNNIGLLSGVDVDLMVEGSVLYYTKAQDLLNGKAIDIIDVPSGEDDDEGEDVEEEEEEEEVSPPVLIQVKAGDVELINNETPKTDKNGYYKIKKANDGNGISDIKIKLDHYNEEMHEHKVTVTATVKNHDSNQYSFTLNKEDASVSISIKPSKNGANEKVYIELEVKTQMTDGEKTDTRNYNFITS